MSVDDFSGLGNAPIELASPGEQVTLRWVTLEATDEEFARFSSWLAPAEHARAARFSRRQLSRRYIVGRAALRATLGALLDVPPADVPIVRGERGRPQLANGGGIDFNVSHTQGVGVIGVARAGRIGVDVERADRDVHADGLARKFLTPSEQATLASLPEAARRERFLRYWTCKEAMSKATGHGLSAPFRDLEIRLGEGLELARGPGLYAPERWTLHSIDVPRGYLATLALWSPR